MHPLSRQQLPVAQPLFPSAILTVVPKIIEMLDDVAVDSGGISGKCLVIFSYISDVDLRLNLTKFLVICAIFYSLRCCKKDHMVVYS